MSRSRSININLKEELSSVEILKKLLEYGWTFKDCGKTTYLPIGDSEDFGWISENINKESLFKIIIEKENKKEVVGVVLTWENTEVGGSLLFWDMKSFSLNIRTNPKFVDNLEGVDITDVSWYLENLLLPLNKNGNLVESFTYEEY